jgi:hypothetical protein
MIYESTPKSTPQALTYEIVILTPNLPSQLVGLVCSPQILMEKNEEPF